MERTWLIVACSLSLTLAACGSVEFQADPNEKKSSSRSAFVFELSPGGEIITVQTGDTVSELAERYDATARQIIIINNIRPPYQIQSGQRLRLPPSQRLYRVQEGDSLSGIAAKFRVNSEEIAVINFLPPPYRLNEGDWLGIPLSDRENLGQNKDLLSGQKKSSKNLKSDSVIVTTEDLEPLSLGREPLVSSKKAIVSKRERKLGASVEKAAKASGLEKEFLTPLDGPVISDFGSQADGRRNDGINISAPRGAPVRSVQDGEVIYSGDALQGYGNLVLIKHRDGYVSAYAHMESILAKRGVTVSKGQTIGTVGSSGGVPSPQLHFELRKNNVAIDPAALFPKR
ncbi:MAG: peptidoglycan DD-metalloendopeptidase family protein [Rhodospirillales bacterium]